MQIFCVAHALGHQQPAAIIQYGCYHGPEAVIIRHRIGYQILLDPDVAHPAIRGTAGGPAQQPPRLPGAARGLQQIVAPVFAANMLLCCTDDSDQPAAPLLAIDLHQTAQFLLQTSRHLRIHKAAGGPVEDAQAQRDQQRIKQGVAQRQPDRGGVQQPTEIHRAGSPRRARCATGESQNPCRSWRAGD